MASPYPDPPADATLPCSTPRTRLPCAGRSPLKPSTSSPARKRSTTWITALLWAAASAPSNCGSCCAISAARAWPPTPQRIWPWRNGWAGRIRAHPRLELGAAATLGLVCFRSRRGDSATRDLLERINASRRFYLSHTVLRRRLTIRAAIGNIRTTRRDLADLWHEIAASEAATAALPIADINIRNMASY